ncbi:MAG: hypothetical protein KC496_08155 [Anaerolineae bacterium]|nr:hypothetical protein [Anaerolineae bacterium]
MNAEVIVRWHNNDQTILYATVPTEWTWEDAYVMIERIYQLQETVNHPTDIIFDLRHINPLPKSAIPNLRRMLNSEHPNDRLNIIVTRDTFLRQMLELVVRTFSHDRKNPAQSHFTTSLEKALEAISQYESQEARL